MRLSDWLSYIESLHPKSIDLSLAHVEQVGQRAGILKPNAYVVLVAGTNGKGTTLSALEQLLLAAHKNVGSYTSPHLCQFNERVRINGVDASDQMWIDAFEHIEKHRQNTPLTYFEFTTLAAFYIFKQHEQLLDVLLCEIGLGGRLDAVNVLQPNLSIITSIHYDHQEWLGEHLEDIAAEKAGILRERVPCLLGENVRQIRLQNKIDALQCPHFYAERDFGWIDTQFSQWAWAEMTISAVDVPQNDLPENSVSLALAAYNIFRKRVSSLPLSQVVSSLSSYCMPGRYQVVRSRPRVILDVAHNSQSCDYLYTKLMQHKPAGQRWAVWAMLGDKPIDWVASRFKAVFAGWYVPQLKVPRARNANELSEVLHKHQIEHVVCCHDVQSAVEQALENANELDEIVVFGSFHVVGDALSYFKDSFHERAKDTGRECHAKN